MSSIGQSFAVEEHRVRADTGGADGFFEAFLSELDDMRAKVREFPAMDPSDVLLTISGLAGRVAEMRVALQRVGTTRCNQLRTREVDPLREDLDLQFKIHSRRISLMEFELKMTGGAV